MNRNKKKRKKRKKKRNKMKKQKKHKRRKKNTKVIGSRRMGVSPRRIGNRNNMSAFFRPILGTTRTQDASRQWKPECWNMAPGKRGAGRPP